MDYLNFDLRIGASDRRTYPVSVIQSPAGEASASLQLPLDDPAFLQSLQTLENVRGTSRGTRIPDTAERDLGVLPTGASELTSVQVVGRALFEALFPPEVLSCYRNSLAAARAQKKCLRVRLRVEAAELSVLPWEFLYDAREGDYVSLLRETPVTRYLEMGLPADPLTIQPPIRILGMVASPNNLPLLDATMERRRMVEAIDHLVESRAVELKWVEGQTWRDLSRTLQEGDWHIFHFIGHGGFSPDLGEGLIALVDEASGGANFLSATQLGRLFAAHPAMRLAVLNACEGARASEHNRFSSVGAVLALRGIPAVVSMQFAITDRAAIEFCRTFYDGLARGMPVDGAVQEARIAISMALGDSAEWGTPVLHMRAPDGTLFRVDMAGAIFRRPAELPPATTPASEQAPQPVEAEQPARSTTAATGETRRGLDILRRKVRQYWIDGVLEKSLFQAVLIDLSMQRMQDAVDSPWAEIPWTEPVRTPRRGEPTIGPAAEAGGYLRGRGRLAADTGRARLRQDHLHVGIDSRACWIGSRRIRSGLCRWSSICPPGSHHTRPLTIGSRLNSARATRFPKKSARAGWRRVACCLCWMGWTNWVPSAGRPVWRPSILSRKIGWWEPWCAVVCKSILICRCA